MSRSVQALIDDAARLFEEFSGHEAAYVDTLDIPPMPPVVCGVGECLGILYRATRDGKSEDYIHRFKARARPLFAVSPDGKMLYLLGGAYDFTERGIVDRD
jgi:hypothetical protein